MGQVRVVESTAGVGPTPRTPDLVRASGQAVRAFAYTFGESAPTADSAFRAAVLSAISSQALMGQSPDALLDIILSLLQEIPPLYPEGS